MTLSLLKTLAPFRSAPHFAAALAVSVAILAAAPAVPSLDARAEANGATVLSTSRGAQPIKLGYFSLGEELLIFVPFGALQGHLVIARPDALQVRFPPWRGEPLGGGGRRLAR